MKQYQIGHTKQSNRNHLLTIAICIIFSALFFSFMFRDAIISIPNIIDKKAILSFEELVPIYDMNTQLKDQLFKTTSTITSNSEIRVGYSITGTWMRYFAFMPFMLILVPTLTVFLVSESFRKITSAVIDTDNSIHSKQLLSIVAYTFGFLITLMLMYSKLAHFYSLIFGFGLFAYSISQIFFSIENSKVNNSQLALIFFATLLNPSIHFVVLIIVFLFIYLFIKMILSKIGLYSKIDLKITLKLLLSLLTAILIYIVWIYITVLSKHISSETIAYNYLTIYNSSLPILHSFLLHTTSQLDNLIFGSYLIRFPRLLGLFILALSLVPLLRKKQLISGSFKDKYLIILLMTIIFMFLATGLKFNENINIYSLISLLSDKFTFINSFVDIFVNILRLSHRFQFPAYVLIGGLATISGYRLLIGKKKLIQVLSMIVVLLVAIIFGTNFKTIFSGNTSGYMKPNTIIANDLNSIKKILDKSKVPVKIAVFPSLELGRVLTTNEGNVTFIDKTILYYLNVPGWYYGSGASERDRIFANYLYNLSRENKNQWIELLSTHSGVTYIIAPTTLEKRKAGGYYPGIENKIINDLEDGTELLYKGESFSLYKVGPYKNRTELYVDGTSSSWTNKDINNQYSPVKFDISKCPKDKDIIISTALLSTIIYDCITKDAKVTPIYKYVNKLSPNVVFGSTYAISSFSIDGLSKNSSYNHIKLNILNLVNMRSSTFVASRFPKKDVTVKYSDCYKNGDTVLLRASSNKSYIMAIFINSKLGIIENIKLEDANHIENTKSLFSYYIGKSKTNLCFNKINVIDNQIALDNLTITSVNVKDKYNAYKILKIVKDLYKIRIN